MVETEVLLTALIELVLQRYVVEEGLSLVRHACATLHLTPDDDTYAVIVEAAAEAIGEVCASGLARRAIVVVDAEVEVGALEELACGLVDL